MFHILAARYKEVQDLLVLLDDHHQAVELLLAKLKISSCNSFAPIKKIFSQHELNDNT